jgi:predicted dehydrogenase
VAALATANPERVARASSELPDTLVVPDLDALLEVDGLDLVVLATPTGLHSTQAERVIEAGVALVVDKPLARTASEAQQVVDLAAHRGVPLTVFQNRRFDPELTALLAVRDQGLLGEIRRAEYRWDRWRPVPKQRWRETQTAEEGAGLLLDLGTHLIDQAVILHGDVESVYAELFAHTVVAEDDIFVACRHTSGVVSHVMASADSSTKSARSPSSRTSATRSAGSFAGTFASRDRQPARATSRTSIGRSAPLCSPMIRRLGCRSTRGTQSTSSPWWTRPAPVTRVSGSSRS